MTTETEGDNVVELLNPNHIYMWYEADYHAIKVGMGRNPNGRMVEYCEGYEFTPSELIAIPVPEIVNVRGIEIKCHAALLEAGLKQLRPAREVFALGTKLKYEQAVKIVEHVVREALANAYEALAKHQRAPHAAPTPVKRGPNGQFVSTNVDKIDWRKRAGAIRSAQTKAMREYDDKVSAAEEKRRRDIDPRPTAEIVAAAGTRPSLEEQHEQWKKDRERRSVIREDDAEWYVGYLRDKALINH